MKKKIKSSRLFIYQNQKKWFELYKDFVVGGKILVVGHGLGYTTEIVHTLNQNVTSVDIGVERDTIMKDKVIVYDGLTLPFENNSFDAVVITYVLHHAENMPRLFEEIVRVSKSKVIILEETYKNFFQKIDLIYYCWLFNRIAGQKVGIHWSSYLTSKRIMEVSSKTDLKLESHQEEPLRSYKTELFVFSKNQDHKKYIQIKRI